MEKLPGGRTRFIQRTMKHPPTDASEVGIHKMRKYNHPSSSTTKNLCIDEVSYVTLYECTSMHIV